MQSDTINNTAHQTVNDVQNPEDQQISNTKFQNPEDQQIRNANCQITSKSVEIQHYKIHVNGQTPPNRSVSISYAADYAGIIRNVVISEHPV
jgi:hypothetical protein